MLATLAMLLAGRKSMQVQVSLDRDDPIYTNQDSVSGEIIIESNSSLNLSTISVSLAGIAVSRSGGSSETHQILQKTKKIFPPAILDSTPGYSGVTLSKGRHIFPFSITPPQVSECYKSSIGTKKSVSPCVEIKGRQKREVHLLRRLPPSCGEAGSAAEIKYFLETMMTGKGIPKGCQEVARNILFYPMSEPLPAQHPSLKRQCIAASSESLDPLEKLTWQVDMELLKGPYLVLGQSIPLRVKLTKVCGHDCQIWLNDFQSMLIETTQVQARGSFETSNRFWIIQTMANMKRKICDEDVAVGTMIYLPADIWNSHALHLGLASSFEVCNIKRIYTLDVRLGLQVGQSKPRLIIREFQFPVYVTAPNSSVSHLLRKSAPLSMLPPQPTSNERDGTKTEDINGACKEIA